MWPKKEKSEDYKNRENGNFEELHSLLSDELYSRGRFSSRIMAEISSTTVTTSGYLVRFQKGVFLAGFLE